MHAAIRSSRHGGCGIAALLFSVACAAAEPARADAADADETAAAPRSAMHLYQRFQRTASPRTALDDEESTPLQRLAKGTLLRAQLNPRSNLALRLRGGRLGVYLQVQLAGDD